MPSSKRYLLALVVQALGPLSLLALSVAISQSRGADVQGQFAASKAWIDLVVAVGLFGLPQSIVLAVNRGGVSRASLYAFATRWAAAALLLVAGGAVGWAWLEGERLLPALLLAFTAAAWILAGLWRGVLLTAEDGLRFNLVTVLPTLILVALTAGALVLGRDLETLFPVLFALAGLLGAIGCYAMARGPVHAAGQGGSALAYRSLFVNGLDVFAQTVCASLQVYACYWILERAGGDASVGRMSIALLVLNAFNFPLQSVSPMLLNRWSKDRSGRSLTDGSAQVRLLAAAFLALSLLTIAAAVLLGPLLFQAGEQPHPGLWLLLLSVTPALLSRTAALRLAAQGQFRFNSKLAALQVALFAVGFATLASRDALEPTVAAALCWVAADVVIALLFALRLRAERRRAA